MSREPTRRGCVRRAMRLPTAALLAVLPALAGRPLPWPSLTLAVVLVVAVGIELYLSRVKGRRITASSAAGDDAP